MADRRREIAQLMRDREHEGQGFIDFQQDTVDWDGIVDAIASALRAQPTVEHAVRLTNGAMQVRNPAAQAVYPMTEWIRHVQENGEKVYCRTVIVVEDWQEVPVTREPDADPKLSQADST